MVNDDNFTFAQIIANNYTVEEQPMWEMYEDAFNDSNELTIVPHSMTTTSSIDTLPKYISLIHRDIDKPTRFAINAISLLFYW